MASFREYRRRAWLPLAALALAAYYIFVFVPLTQRSRGLDEPLQKGWRKLATALEQTNATVLDFRQITNQLAQTRLALAALDDLKKKAAARLELPPALRARLGAPFQLVDYQNERSKQMDLLDQAAKQAKIAVDPAVYTGFPEHTADLEEPALLWAALAFTDDFLDLAVRCKVSALHSLDVPLTLTNPAVGDNNQRWTELAFQVQFSASATNALRLLESLPLRGDELRASGLTNDLPGKLPLFMDRLIIRKESPEKLDEVRVWVRAVGFVLRES